VHRSDGDMKHVANKNDLFVRKESSIPSRDVKDTCNGRSIVYRAVREMKILQAEMIYC